MKNSKILALFLALSTPLVAKPTGGVFVKGEGGIAHPSHCEMKIHANDQTVIHWNSFSIDKGERVQFVQPNAQAHVVNHVVSNHLSEIYGTLEANGHVYLINPAGIVIGKEGIIHAAGFIASTFDFTETKEGMLFKGSSRATIENYGTVSTTHGDVFLIGYQIVNGGTLKGETVGLGEGSEILLKPEGNARLFIQVGEETTEEGIGIHNHGTIQALKTELKANGNAFAYAIKNDGLIEATGVEKRGGEVYLFAKEGTVVHQGEIIAEGGVVHLLGQTVVCNENSLVDVSSDSCGGTILVGGDRQGGNPDIPNAAFATLEKGATLKANARVEGDGGKIILFSTVFTDFQGRMEGMGGFNGGDGGFGEVSGGTFNAMGTPCFKAFQGKPGELLFDPADLTITTAADSQASIIAGQANFTGTPALLNNATINGILDGGTSVTIDACGGPGVAGLGGSGDITVLEGAPITWTGAAGGVNITLIGNNITLRDDVYFIGTGSAVPPVSNVTLRAAQDILIEPLPGGNNTPVCVGSVNGTVTVEACRDITLRGGTNPLTVVTNATFGPTAIIGDRHGLPALGAANLFGSQGDIIVSCGRDLLLQGGSGSSANGFVSSEVLIGRLSQSLNVKPPYNTYVTVDIIGNITVNVGRDFTMRGGVGAGVANNHGLACGAYVGLVADGPAHTNTRLKLGDYTINVGRNFDLEGGLRTAGTGSIGIPLIGNSAAGDANAAYVGGHQGNITINVGENMYLHNQAGPVGNSAGPFIGGAQRGTGYAQNLYVTVGQNLTMDMSFNTGGTTMQPFNTTLPPGAPPPQECFIRVGGDWTMIAGPGFAGCVVALHSNYTNRFYVGGNLRQFNGLGGEATIFPNRFPAGTGNFNPNNSLGNFDLRAGGNVTLAGGLTTSAFPFPNTRNFTSPSDVRMEADAAFPTGFLWTAMNVTSPTIGTACSSCTGVNIFAGTPLEFDSGNQSTVAPFGLGGDELGGFQIDSARYNTASAAFGTTSINGYTGNLSSPLAPIAPSVAASAGLQYTVENNFSIFSADRFEDGTPADLTLGDANNPNRVEASTNNGNLTIDHFRNIGIEPLNGVNPSPNPTVLTSGDLLIIANNDIEMFPNASITGANNVTLVVDNQAPVAPQIGGVWSSAGRFLMDQTASLVSNTSGSGGLLSVYTALQAQNVILGTLNGALFFPGTRFINTATEEWCIYYPGGTTGPVFTIFYKPCAAFIPLAQIPIAELFFDLHSPDEYLGWPEEFKFIYNDIRKHTLWERFNHQDEEKHYLRRKYYYMNNPKSYRDFVELYEKK